MRARRFNFWQSGKHPFLTFPSDLWPGRTGVPIQREHEELLAALTERLRVEGAPQGIWLVELAQARTHLQQLDDLLRRLADALLAGIPPIS